MYRSTVVVMPAAIFVFGSLLLPVSVYPDPELQNLDINVIYLAGSNSIPSLVKLCVHQQALRQFYSDLIYRLDWLPFPSSSNTGIS